MPTPTEFMDPMDAVINQLQPRDTNENVLPVAQPEQPEQKPAEVVPVETKTNVEPKFDIDKEIDDLLELVKKEPTKSEVKEDVKEKVVKKEIKVPKLLEKPDNQELSVDEREEITNYIYDLEEQLANIEFDRKREGVEKSQLEQMLEKERSKSNEVFDKLKELEWELKKTKSVTSPDELQTLIDCFKLNKDNSTLYNKRNLVGEAARIIEQITEKPMDPYIMDRIKSGSSFNKESAGSDMDLPKAPEQKKDSGYNVLQF